MCVCIRVDSNKWLHILGTRLRDIHVVGSPFNRIRKHVNAGCGRESKPTKC